MRFAPLAFPNSFGRGVLRSSDARSLIERPLRAAKAASEVNHAVCRIYIVWCCIDMRLADDRREHLPTFNECALRSGVSPTSLARVPGKPQKLLGAEFRVSPRNLLCGVSLPGGGTTGVGVDERVESASGSKPWFILLDVDQIVQAAPVRPLVEPHGSMPSFDDPDQASDEVEAVRTVIPLAITSVDLHGDRLVHAFLLGARVRLGRRGEAPAEPRGYRDPNIPSVRGG
jgi:hypothetical protein